MEGRNAFRRFLERSRSTRMAPTMPHFCRMACSQGQILLRAAQIHKVPRNSMKSSPVALFIGDMYANMEVARLKTWCHQAGIKLTRSLHGAPMRVQLALLGTKCIPSGT